MTVPVWGGRPRQTQLPPQRRPELTLPAGPGGASRASQSSPCALSTLLLEPCPPQSKTVLPPCDPIVPPLLPARALPAGQQGWLPPGAAAGSPEGSLPQAPGPCEVTVALREALDSREGLRDTAAREGHPRSCFCMVTLLSLQVICLFSPFDLIIRWHRPLCRAGLQSVLGDRQAVILLPERLGPLCRES